MPSQYNPIAQSRPARIASALLLVLLWCIYWFVHAWHYWEDDAYIHLEFARSLAAGRGFAFNGRVVAGDTAPLWVFLLAAMHALVPGWLVAGKVLTALGATPLAHRLLRLRPPPRQLAPPTEPRRRLPRRPACSSS